MNFPRNWEISRFMLRRLLEEREENGTLVKGPRGRACAMRTKTGTVLYVTEGERDIGNPVWNNLYVRLNSECVRRGMELELLLYTGETAEEIADRAEASRAGVIVNTMYTPSLLEYGERRGKRKMIFTDQRCEEAAGYLVSRRNETAGVRAADLFYEHGYRKPFLLSCLFETGNGTADLLHLHQERAFQERCRALGMVSNPDMSLRVFGVRRSTDKLLDFLMKLESVLADPGWDCDCCFSTDPFPARLFDSFLRKRNLNGREGVPLITSSGSGLDCGEERRITSLSAPLDKQAQCIAELSEKLLTGRRVVQKKHYFDFKYMEGETFPTKQ